MKHRWKQNGLTLTELVVVVAVAAILLGISVPTAKKIMNSFEHSTGAAGLIDAALSNARALAIASNTEAGVRFQHDKNGDFYMIFILHDPASTGLVRGFRAYPNRRPLKLPEQFGVMEATLTAANPNTANTELDTNPELLNKQTFSIVFSPQGKLILYDVRARNRDGIIEPALSADPVFNTRVNIANGTGMFVQDDYPADGLQQESSVHSFYIYEKKRLAETPAAQRFTGCIGILKPEFVNPYTGQLVKR